MAAPAPLPPKLAIERATDGAIAWISLAGTIDEDFSGGALGASVAGDTLVLDLGGVRKISSFGIREWIDFMRAAVTRVRQVILVECAPKVVDQLNMVANFAGGGRVYSCYAPYRCDFCDSESRVLVQVDRDHDAIRAHALPERPCPRCHEAMYFDDDGPTFFSYLAAQERFALEPAVEHFLAARHAGSELPRKLRIDKVVDGRTTYVRLTGDLDGAFPRDKLAEGLEGTVLVDLGGIGGIEPAGAVAWRGFVQRALGAVEHLYLAAAPPAFVERLCTRDDLGPVVQLVTLRMPYACPGCQAMREEVVDIAAHYEVLKFATAPELRCPRCKAAMPCQASDAMMALMPGLPRPTASSELIRAIAGLRERATAPRQAGGVAAGGARIAGAAAPARNGLLIAILAALIAVALAAGAYLAYQRYAGDAPGAAIARPSWMPVAGAPACRDGGGGALHCTGEAVAATEDDAADEAADAAYEAAAAALAARITDRDWQRVVPPLYTAARDALRATGAPREQRAARRAVAHALRVTGGALVPAAPSQQLAGGPPGRVHAYAELALPAPAVASLIAIYARPATALGATAVGAFPLVAWRHPRAERGAIITAIESGPLDGLGLAPGHLVLTVAGRDVEDAGSLALLLAEEHATLASRGGSLRLGVQTAAPQPRELSLAIAAPTAPTTSPPGKRPPGRAAAPTGSINIWDRTNQVRPNSDDPAQ